MGVDVDDLPRLSASLPRGTNGDRKSTRLNSSHPSISYAVFCLKKKTHARAAADVSSQLPPGLLPAGRSRRAAAAARLNVDVAGGFLLAQPRPCALPPIARLPAC